jgi:hypothetical protein
LDEVFSQRIREANEFYGGIHAPHLNDDEQLVQRQAFAGLLWSKQFYQYDGYRWLAGDPAQPPPAENRRRGRNRDWFHLDNADVILMPDKWEYPWYASWDLAFHCVVMALIDPCFAKEQIKLLTTPRYQHPYGTIPAYEWDFNAVNPPVIAWAAWQVYQLDRAQRGHGDLDFLMAVFQPLVMMLSWWLNRKDKEGTGIFGGGFLGLDNIGVFDRDQPLPTGGTLEQSDGTGWMATFQLHMMEIALELSLHDTRYVHMLQRFGQDFVLVANVLQKTAAGGTGLWDTEEGFYCDVIRLDSGKKIPLRIHSIAGLVPLFANAVINKASLAQLPSLMRTMDSIMERRPFLKEILASWEESGSDENRLLSVVYGDRLKTILKRVLDEDQFLSDYGVRSLSRYHLDQPFSFNVNGDRHEVKYLPGVSDNRVFGGNSNWRGPIWFPLNFLLLQSLNTFARHYGDEWKVECPTGSGQYLTLAEVGDDVAERLCRIFLRGSDGKRPVFGNNHYFNDDPHWRDCIPFHEYFHADNGSGMGASHQTGWTALVAILLQYGGALHFDHLYRTPDQQSVTEVPA